MTTAGSTVTANVWKRPLSNQFVRVMKDSFTQFPEHRMIVSNDVASNLHERVTGKRQAAVLVPICNRNQVPSLLFTLRTETVGSHKGHVSFPGGHIDTGENAVEAALREAHEELGLAPQDVQILGLGQTAPALTGTLVTPVIGFLKKDVGDLGVFKKSAGEVDQIFTRTVEELLLPGNKGSERLLRGARSRAADMIRNSTTVKLPYYGQRDDPYCIWGLTAWILEGVLNHLLIPSAEKMSSLPSLDDVS